MVWPTTPVSTANMDAGPDSPAAARAELLQQTQQVNQMRDHVSTFAATLLDDASAAAARNTLGGTLVGQALYTAVDASAARTALGLYDSVFTFSAASTFNGVGASYTAVTLAVPGVSKGIVSTGNFVSPRAGHVRCRVGRMSYTVASGTVTGVSLRFSVAGTFQVPEYFANDNARYVSAEAIFACTAGQVFGVGCAASGGGTANVALGGISFEMMD